MKTVTSIKLDPHIKDQAALLASELGLTLSSVINASLRQFVTDRRLTLRAPRTLNDKTQKKYLKLDNDVRKGKNLSPAFTTVSALKKSLLS